MAHLAVSVDIGSTWTKGALVELDDSLLIARRETPTTNDDLSRGFERVYEILSAEAVRRGKEKPEIYLSSSAKGGLRVGAIGLVPELTLKAARLAVASAGGKVVGTFSYKLTPKDLKILDELRCDLILLAGGTDGGDETYILHNAKLIADSSIDAAIVYAGNAAAREEALRILKNGGKRAVGSANILPDLNRLEINEARRAIADLFLERIIEGRGLSAIRTRCSAEPKPTPAAVFELVKSFSENAVFGSAGVVVVDMGGATTDVYSACDGYRGAADTVYRGIPEPRVKRTVEGDLGLRVSARHVLEGIGNRTLGRNDLQELENWVSIVSTDTGRRAETERERLLDDMLASACVGTAISRHAGHLEPVYTASGLVWVQTGKDLRDIDIAIGTGGRLSFESSGALFRNALHPSNDEGPTQNTRISLVPNADSVRYLRDSQYIIPLAANLVAEHAEVARKIAMRSFVEDAERSAVNRDGESV